MTGPQDDRIAPLLRELDEASATLAGIAWLTRAEGERLGTSIDRLTSYLTRINPSGSADIDRAD